MCLQGLKEQQKCHEAAVDLADVLHAKLPITEIIPERMQSDQIRSSLRSILEVIRQAFLFLNGYVKISVSRMSYLDRPMTSDNLHRATSIIAARKDSGLEEQTLRGIAQF